MEKINEIMKSIPPYIGAIYITGFIVLNIHLSKWGIIEKNIINVDYLKAGTWCFLFIAIPILLPIFLVKNSLETELKEILANGGFMSQTLIKIIISFVTTLIYILILTRVSFFEEPLFPVKALLISLSITIVPLIYYSIKTIINSESHLYFVMIFP